MSDAPLPRRFTGRVALITGAASGIGRAVTLRLAAEGARVCAVDVDAAGLAETAAQATGPGAVRTAVVDVGRPAECRAAVADCVREHGRLDVLGNVAGVMHSEHFTEMTEEGYRRLMDVNVGGPVFLSQAAIPHLLVTGGNIVNIGSVSGIIGTAYNGVYCASKGAVTMLTRSLALEYAKSPLRINAIAPGGVVTNLVTNMDRAHDTDDDLMAHIRGFRPYCAPEDVANLFAFLASDEAANIHGSVMPTDGGVTAF